MDDIKNIVISIVLGYNNNRDWSERLAGVFQPIGFFDPEDTRISTGSFYYAR